MTVLFLCTGNSARSQMAEALLRHLSKGQIDVVSAGSAPQPEVHPLATATLRNNYDIDPSDLYPKPISVFRGRHFDYVITVCDRAAESCPEFPGDPQRLHWSFEDPASIQDEVEQRRAFDKVAAVLAGRLRTWLLLPDIATRVAAR
jgi:ArsR family transcriptional regulator, arsenate/arsenite/antimonite-responsive transcriptional repressor / arsenate reductase (thioredoxin)